MPADLQPSPFDYSQLDSEARIVVRQRTNEIKTLMRRTAQDVIEIGEKLIEVKETMGHGKFGEWLEKEFSWSWKTATKFMSVAEHFSNLKNSSNLTMSFETMAYLASPSVPEEVRQEVVSRAQAGEHITTQAARQTVSEHHDDDPEDDDEPAEIPAPRPYAPQHTTAAAFEQTAPEPPLIILRKKDTSLKGIADALEELANVVDFEEDFSQWSEYLQFNGPYYRESARVLRDAQKHFYKLG